MSADQERGSVLLPGLLGGRVLILNDLALWRRRRDYTPKKTGPNVKRNARDSAVRSGLFYGAALAVIAGWCGFLAWLNGTNGVPLDFEALWHGTERPTLRPRVLGMQELHSGAALTVEEANPAFLLGGERAVLLGRWSLPRHQSTGTWGAWIKLKEAILDAGTVPFAGTAPPLNWGFGAINGKPAAWMAHRGSELNEVVEVASKNPYETGRWTHVAFVLHAGRCVLWVDGKIAGEAPYNGANPGNPDVWLGRVRRTFSNFTPPLPKGFGGLAPDFLLDDFVVFSRALSEQEVMRISRAGPGGIERAERNSELLETMRGATPWMLLAISGLVLLGAFPRLTQPAIRLWQPAFIPAWLVLFAGGAITTWATFRLARNALDADREKLDLFAEQLRQAGETSFERVADLLRRGRDYLRANPDTSSPQLRAWAEENGATHDHSGIHGLAWATLRREKEEWTLPVVAYTAKGAARRTPNWSWQGSVAQLLANNDVAATGLLPLEPFGTNSLQRQGIQLFLPVFKEPMTRRQADPEKLSGVLFATIDLAPMVASYWRNLPPIIGARFIPGLPHSREAVAVDTGDLFPATRRPLKPYREAEVAIRVYGRRIWVQLWTTPAFHGHSRIDWPWVSAVIGSLFTVLSSALVALQAAGRLKQHAIAAELKESRDALRAAQKERESLGRELHDGVIQSLYAVQLQLGRVKQNGNSDSAEVAAVQAGLSSVIGELREYTSASPVVGAEAISLPQVLESIVKRTQLASGSAIHLSFEDRAVDGLSQLQAVHLANIAREGLSNALRHAAPANVWIELKQTAESETALEIRDDGAGFVEEQSVAGQGLRNMRARAQELGARYECHSRNGSGTVLRVLLPKDDGLLEKEGHE